MDINIPCNVPRCDNTAEEYIYCDKHFERLIEDAKEEGRDEIREENKIGKQ